MKKRTRTRLVTREQWGARGPESRPVLMNLPAPRTWIHHSASHFPRNPKWTEKMFLSQAKVFIQGVQAFHMDSKGWNDIGYSFVVMKPFLRKCWVFEGRGWGVVGAHTEGDNSNSHGICVVGNFDIEGVGKRLLQGLRELIDRGVEKKRIAKPRAGQPTGGHQDAPGAATACPGRNLYRKLEELRHPY